MDYDPIKFRIARLLGKKPLFRRLFHLGLDILFLRSWWVRRELWAMKKTMNKGGLALDAGMGFGQYSDRMARMFPKASVVGLEIDQSHLYGAEKYFASEHPDFRFIVGDVQETPLASSKFDLILSVDVMEHIPDDEATFREFYRILKPGGTFIMHTPRNKAPVGVDRDMTTDEGWVVGEHVRDGYRDVEASERLKRAGFEVKRLTHGYGAFGMAAWTLMQRIPLGLMAKGWTVLAVPFILLALPFGLAAMLLDLIPGEQPEGGSLLAIVVKPK